MSSSLLMIDNAFILFCLLLRTVFDESNPVINPTIGTCVKKNRLPNRGNIEFYYCYASLWEENPTINYSLKINAESSTGTCRLIRTRVSDPCSMDF